MIKLRDYQKQCLLNVTETMKTADKIAVVMPTGSGKTAVFGGIVDEFLRNNKFGRVVVVSHLSLLVTQTKQRFKEDWDIDAGVLQADIYPNENQRVITTTMQTFRDIEKVFNWVNKQRKYGKTNKIKDLDIRLIIIDECHRMGCGSYTTIIDHFKDTNTKFIGFTATPFRENKLMTNMFETVAYTISCRELIDRGFLVPPVLNETPFDTSDLENLCPTVVNIIKDKHYNDKCVIYLKTIESCNDMRNVLVASDVSASAITSNTAPQVRDQILGDFRKDKGVNVLVTCDVLTAGFDSPNIKCILMPYKVGSVTTYLQRIGRGLRLMEGKDSCQIYVTSDSPDIQKGFWQKITKEILEANSSRSTHDTFYDELDYTKYVDKERYRWTQEVVDMAEKSRGLNYINLWNNIIQKRMPESLLNLLVKDSPVRAMAKANIFIKPSLNQLKYLTGYKRLSENSVKHLSKQECSFIISAYERDKINDLSEEERRSNPNILQFGKYKDYHFDQVPPRYWRWCKDNSPKSKSYLSWCKYRNRKYNKGEENFIVT